MRIVIKVGTQIIAGTKGLNQTKIRNLIAEIALLVKKGHEIILVSSGAIGAGLPVVNFSDISLQSNKKVASAVGQPLLMHDYIRAAKKHKITVAQIIILNDDLTNKEHFQNFVLNIENMLHHKVLPIINENDVMKREDLLVGDNDNLSAIVAVGLKANKLIILTNQEGLFTANPDIDKNAKLIKKVAKVDAKIEKLCHQKKSALGRGGMITKVEAAKYATSHGVETFIGRGNKKNILINAVIGKNFSGTRFLAQK